jgi:fructose-1,6-bisphosphatase/inositol monophosphatase family enzyme
MSGGEPALEPAPSLAAEPALAAERAVAAEPAFAAELDFAAELAKQAGRILIDRYERVEQIDYKSARDVVTEVDHLSEELIIRAIRDAWPDDAILAEESGQHRAIRREAGSMGQGRTWVIDPLDGTINYANGIPFFCVSIGLLVDGHPQLGIVHDPTRGETFSATADMPASLEDRNGDRVIVASDKERLSDFVISLALSGSSMAGRLRAIRKQIRVPRSMGSAALALTYVANGRFDAFIQRGGLSAWDVAAAGLIAERGGATVTDMTGGTWFDLERRARSIGILAAPPPHHAALLELVR